MLNKGFTGVKKVYNISPVFGASERPELSEIVRVGNRDLKLLA